LGEAYDALLGAETFDKFFGICLVSLESASIFSNISLFFSGLSSEERADVYVNFYGRRF